MAHLGSGFVDVGSGRMGGLGFRTLGSSLWASGSVVSLYLE